MWFGLTGEPCRNGWTDRDAAWIQESYGSKKPCIRTRYIGLNLDGNGQFSGGFVVASDLIRSSAKMGAIRTASVRRWCVPSTDYFIHLLRTRAYLYKIPQMRHLSSGSADGRTACSEHKNLRRGAVQLLEQRVRANSRVALRHITQACAEPCPSALNVALPAFAAGRWCLKA